MFIRIPVPATTGYFNIGDIFVILAGLWLGPIQGMLVGAIGPTLADFIGFPQFALATAVTKGLEGFVVGAIAKSSSSQGASLSAVAAACGGVIMVVGYFIFEAFIYPLLGRYLHLFNVTDLGAAMVEVLPNTIQAFIGAAGGLALWTALSGGKTTRA